MPVIPFIPGSGGRRAVSSQDLGRGFKLNIADGEEAIRNWVFDNSKTHAVPYQETSAKSYILDTAEQVSDSLMIDGELSLSYGPMISGSGGGKYLKTKLSTKHKSSLVYRSFQPMYATCLKAQEPTLDAKPLFEPTAIPEELANKYGTMFISQLIYGAMLEITFTVATEEDVDMQEIMAFLKGKVGVPSCGPLSVEFDANFEKKDGSSKKSYSMDVEVKVVGANFALPANPDLNEVAQLIGTFNEKVEAMQQRTIQAHSKGTELHALEQLSPIGMFVDSLANYAPTLSQMDAAALQSQMKTLSKCFNLALRWKAKLEASDEVVLKMNQSPKLREQVYVPYSKANKKCIEMLDAKITECLEVRQLPFEQLVGRGTKRANMPTLCPNEDQTNAFAGLCGEGYLFFDDDPKFEAVDNMEFEGYLVEGKAGINGKMFGYGVLSLQKGIERGQYKGQWSLGVREGRGEWNGMDFRNGMDFQFDGEWKADKKDGRGVNTFADGGKYDGQFKVGMYEGHGVYTFADGSKYDGQFKADKKDGRGIYTYPDGGKYDGQWKAEKKDGRGVNTFADGGKYDGQFKAGFLEGHGVYTFPDGGKYDGPFKAGKKDGRGVYTYPDGGKYDGHFEAGMCEGHGVYTYPSGGKYDGQWKAGMYEGHGVYTYPDGGKYDGQWKAGMFEGRGVHTVADGSKYDGQFKAGMYEGHGGKR